ncbi:MAG TPA: hypothetical protein VFU22_11685 [Roseiflexaceae bacterium]|nr:hypothetical protein [Roseiflexaceae bacterium]
MQRNKAPIRIFDIKFVPSSYCGAGIMIHLINPTQRALKIYTYITLDTNEVVGAYRGYGEVIGPEDTTEMCVALTFARVNKHARPQIESIKFEDGMKRSLVVSRNTIDRLNDQILNEWPFPESEELENRHDPH